MNIQAFIFSFFISFLSGPVQPPVNPTPIPTIPIEYIVISETPVPTPTRTPTPTPTNVPIQRSDLNDLFTRYSNHYSVNRDILIKIAACESGLNPGAKNGIYGGLFQFSEQSWITIRKRMQADSAASLRFNPEEAIKSAAFKISTDGIEAWPYCRK